MVPSLANKSLVVTDGGKAISFVLESLTIARELGVRQSHNYSRTWCDIIHADLCARTFSTVFLMMERGPSDDVLVLSGVYDDMSGVLVKKPPVHQDIITSYMQWSIYASLLHCM